MSRTNSHNSPVCHSKRSFIRGTTLNDWLGALGALAAILVAGVIGSLVFPPFMNPNADEFALRCFAAVLGILVYSICTIVFVMTRLVVKALFKWRGKNQS